MIMKKESFVKRILTTILVICFLFSFACPVYAVATEQWYEINVEGIYSVYEANTWEEEMREYNCYAYAINLTNGRWNPGDFASTESNQLSYDDEASIEDMVELVVADLKSDTLGYDCVKTQTACPTTTAGWYNVIAARKDTTEDFRDLYDNPFNDFHFAKLVNGEWYHKPGTTAVLKFKASPSNSISWIVEGYADGIWGYNINATYDSDIIYILYKEDHSVSAWRSIRNYHDGVWHVYIHSGTCESCGETVTRTTSRRCSGPPCKITQNIPDDDPVTE